MAEEMITITVEEYESLKEDARFLACLQAYGVDNWEGYSEACQIYHEEE